MNNHNSSLTTTLACTPHSKKCAYRLRYTAYQLDGSIPSDLSGMFTDEFDHSVNSFTFLLSEKDQFIGTIRACVHDSRKHWTRTPALELFSDEIAEHASNDNFVELNRFVLDPAVQDRGRTFTFALFGNAVTAADAFQCRYILAPVRVQHLRFYQRLGFRSISSPRRYHRVSFETTLMIMDWAVQAPVLREHKIFSSIENAAPLALSHRGYLA